MSVQTLLGKIVGMSFYKHAKKIVDLLEVDNPLLLVREKYNKYDDNAIAVYIKLGHIDRVNAAVLAPFADAGKYGLFAHNHICFPATVVIGPEGKGVAVTIMDKPIPHPAELGKKGESDDEIPF